MFHIVSAALRRSLTRQQWFASYASSSSLSSSHSLSIWRRKKEIGKEGLIADKKLKRLQSNPVRLDRFIKSHISRILKSDLVAVLAELQRQDQVFLSMKIGAETGGKGTKTMVTRWIHRAARKS